MALRGAASLTERELIAWMRERMTAFKCPTPVAFTDTLPKGGTGKIQKSLLASNSAVMKKTPARRRSDPILTRSMMGRYF